MYRPEKLKIFPFEPKNNASFLLKELKELIFQGKYLFSYLQDINAKTVIVEPHYFDKNYLEEFAIFYSKSAYGYLNKCIRIHFFSSEFNGEKFKKFLSDDPEISKCITKSYLGFIVIRPFKHAPFGTTVLKKYPDREDQYRRVLIERKYIAHIAGKTLEINGLGWQQQDTAVGTCATIALWTALSSSAFDDHHSIPTTAKITLLAHKTTSIGSRIFPSTGLNVNQMRESIKENDLSPILIQGDIISDKKKFFSKERFLNSLCSFLRSGYPVIAIGFFDGIEGHAICITGFREAPFGKFENGFGFADTEVKYIYAHDDNLGPNVRFEIKKSKKQKNTVYLSSQAPKPYSKQRNDVISDYPDFYPTMLLIAVHNDIAISSDNLNHTALKVVTLIATECSDLINLKENNLTTGTMIIKGTNFLNEKLEEIINDKRILGEVRLDIWEKVRPMPLHIGVIRIGINDKTIIDIIFDTTGIPKNDRAIAHIIYSSSIIPIIDITEEFDFGERIEAF